METRRRSSLPHYQTFPTQPPRSRGKPPVSPSLSSGGDGSVLQQDGYDNGHEQHHHNPPLPKKQLAMLAIIAFAEQTAFSSIAPYLPTMVSTFPGASKTTMGLHVGTIASAFALARSTTNFFWGWLSDRIGRKPVIMLGTILTASCFCAFGFCRTLWQAVVLQALLGLVNGNQGLISTCLREIMDRDPQSKALIYIPVISGIGGIVGPAIGGLLVMPQSPFEKGQTNSYPYLLPNLFSAAILTFELALTGFFLEESLEETKDLAPLKKRIKILFSWLLHLAGGARSPMRLRSHHQDSRCRTDGAADESSDEESTEAGESETQSFMSVPELFPHTHESVFTLKEVLSRNIALLLSTYLIFQLSSTSFNSLYPIFSSAALPTGRGLSPRGIGLSLSFAGIVTTIFQAGVLGKLEERVGRKAIFCAGLLGLFLTIMIMPWIPYRNSPPPFGLGTNTAWLWVEIGFVLLMNSIAATAGRTSVLHLVTTSAPNHSSQSRLNSVAQTLATASQVVGPFMAGGMFSISTTVQPKGEALAWGAFGGIAFVGFLASLGIRADGLEPSGLDEEEGMMEDADEEEEQHDGRVGWR